VTDLGRRGLLKAACAGCAAVGLSACGSGKAATSPPQPRKTSADAASPAGTAIAKLAEVPVGTSIAARAPSGKKLLLFRPTATTLVAYSATCTHQGCIVEPDGVKLSCPCHGSSFDAMTGKVLSGPAPAPLHPFAVKLSGPDVVPA
jgi:Rieske Fe-S protein